MSRGGLNRELAAAGERVLDLLCLADVMARLGCGEVKVRRLVAEGVLVQERYGKLIRYTPESVAAYQRQQAAGRGPSGGGA